MAFTADQLREIPATLSQPRFATYLRAAGGDPAKALDLYAWNLQVSAAFLVPIQICEVGVRNGIAEALGTVYSANWPWSVGFLRALPNPQRAFSPQRHLSDVAKHQPTTGKVVAELKLAFWQHMLTARHDASIWRHHLFAKFPNPPFVLTVEQARGALYGALERFRILRNRIAHHEPIFVRDLNKEYEGIVALIAWRNHVLAEWVRDTQSVTALLQSKPVP